MNDNAREAVLYILERFRKDNSWTAEVLDNSIDKFDLDHRSISFVSRLSLTTIENLNLIDFYISHFSTKRLKDIEPLVLDILHMGICEILFFDRIPDSAAVNTSVNLCKNHSLSRASGFVNAVLRKISHNKDHLPPIDKIDYFKYLSVKYNHPKWFIETLSKKYSTEFIEKLLIANNIICPLSVQVNTLKISSNEFFKMCKEKNINIEQNDYYDSSFKIYESGSIKNIPGYELGYFYIQDTAARSVTECIDILPGQYILDACSAPGGKSFSAAIKMDNSGCIDCFDLHKNKIHKIEEGAQRLGINILQTYEQDARKDIKNKYDAVIADVPCSGMGVIRKRPELRYKDKANLDNLPNIQFDIINNLANNIKIGGYLLYSTCTVLEEENENVIKKFLECHSNFTLQDLTFGNETYHGMHTFFPHIDNTDGFFICKMMRIS